MVIAAVAFGAVYGARQIWFVGTNDADQLALFRGLPYDLPFGIELYSEQESTQTELDSLPEERRAVATDHELRSESDARSLIEDLENAAATTTPTQPNTGRNGTGGKQPEGRHPEQGRRQPEQEAGGNDGGGKGGNG